MMEFWDNINPLVRTIYGVILIYFLLGALGFYLINKHKPQRTAKQSYLKFFTYFIIINFIFWCTVLAPEYFKYVALLIVTVGFLEVTHLFIRSGYHYPWFYSGAVALIIVMGTAFYRFSQMPYQSILFVFLIVSIFDSFSQITGQLWGKKKIVPTISPNKTYGGVIGGIAVALISSFFLGNLYTGVSLGSKLILTVGIIAFAFAGDILASLYKRKYGVKDFNRMIPGHGGFLDRFDSLLAAGAWVVFFVDIQ